MGESHASNTILMTVQAGPQAPTLQEAARILGVTKSDVDASFGVVPIDEERGLFAVKVGAASVASRPASDAVRGPFSNPKIATFGRMK
ncbi:hypothetical protein SAMN04487843_103403 [Methylobacterium sp. ap11]|uniref:hypothetical protein n=1 Tax=Methylobacterium sp. ap11 TaxID=1761799 RepID=UPI0008C36864|nr:hypothetical protein [Methylobacterium sp. ap11]SEO76293.1 hypothetical protein SAMN04487843_103403 [Methylobacterium sp. ap11]